MDSRQLRVRLYVEQKNLDISFHFQKYTINNRCHSNHYEATAHLAFRKQKPPLLFLGFFVISGYYFIRRLIITLDSKW